MFEKTVLRYQNILHIRFQPVFSALPKDALNKITPQNFFRRLLKINLYTLGRLLPNLISFSPKNEDLTGKIWLYVVSQNNYDSLQFLKAGFPESVFVAGQNKQIGRYNKEVNRLSLRWKIFHTALYFLPVFIHLFKIYGKKAFRFFDLVFISIGYYEQYLTHLKKYRPQAIIFSNDHNDDARALLLAANKLDIPTIYIQHASVSLAFPPLEFSLSLLEGEDSLLKYQQCGPISGNVKLIGMPKADKFLQFRSFKKLVEKAAICGGLLDDYELLKETVLVVVKHFPEIQFTFRPHPNDKRDFNFVTALGPNARISNPKTENAFEYLKQQDLVIAADSSIHLEAALLNIPGLYFRFSKSDALFDYYGYVKNGLIQYAETAEELLKLITAYKQNRPEVFTKAAYYNATVGTEYEGHSDVLVLEAIRQLLGS